jgi:hypothetical protein
MEREKSKKMLAHVEGWQQSGMSLNAYSRSIGIPQHTLRYWSGKLKSPAEAKEGYNKVTYPSPGFVEINAPVNNKGMVQGQLPLLPKLQIELNFPNGLCLKIYG